MSDANQGGSTGSTSSNPFASARTERSSAPSESELYTATVYLAQTRPWLLFIGVVGLLLSALLVVVGMGLAIMGGGMTEGMGMIGPVLGTIYAGIGLLYGIPPALMIQQALAITTVTSGGGFEAINEVLRHNRNFWRVVGGFTLFVLVLYCGGFGLLAVVGVAGSGISEF